MCICTLWTLKPVAVWRLPRRQTGTQDGRPQCIVQENAHASHAPRAGAAHPLHPRPARPPPAGLARRRLARGALLGATEAIALVCDEVLEMAWDGVPIDEIVERA